MSKINEFFWYGLATSDPVAATDFYTKVVGWTSEVAQGPGFQYSLVKAQEKPMAGIRPLPAGREGQPVAWLGFVAVADCLTKTRELVAAGGKVISEPVDNVGSDVIAIVADTGGAVFALMTPRGEEPELLDQHELGNVGWHEVFGTPLNEATAFYHQLFGWNKTDAAEFGPGETYQMFNFGEGHSRGGMMAKCPNGSPPAWNFFFNVPSIGAAADAIKANGGQVVMGPQEVPGDEWILHAIDPQGARFALAAKAK